MALRLPRPPVSYLRDWMNQYTRELEREDQMATAAVQQALLNIAPSYTTLQRLNLVNMAGQTVFDTDLGKLAVNTGAGWEIISSAP